MGIPENDEKAQIERESWLWCRIRKFPYKRYMKLNPPNKTTFHNSICQPTRTTTDKQRKDLIRNMLLPDGLAGGRDTVDPLDLMPSEELDKFLSPLTPEEKYSYLSKF
jgi:hypothetical protein